MLRLPEIFQAFDNISPNCPPDVNFEGNRPIEANIDIIVAYSSGFSLEIAGSSQDVLSASLTSAFLMPCTHRNIAAPALVPVATDSSG